MITKPFGQWLPSDFRKRTEELIEGQGGTLRSRQIMGLMMALAEELSAIRLQIESIKSPPTD